MVELAALLDGQRETKPALAYATLINTVDHRCFISPPPPPLSFQYYKQVNIRVALVGLEIFKDANPFNVELSASEVLTSFVQWRKAELLPRIQHDAAQLIV